MIPVIAQRAAELEDLCLRYRVQRLDLFGSATTGPYRPNESDLDFLVEFQPLRFGEYADCYFGLLEGLSQIFGARVNLVVSSAIKNPFLWKSVEDTKTPVYEV